MLLNSTKTKYAYLGDRRLLLLPLAVILLSPSLWLKAQAQQATGREVIFPVTIHWSRQKNVSRYRLQIAADEKFENVFFDRRVSGDRYIVNELSPGYYYWRVASADLQVGEFSRPVRFFISGGVVTSVTLPSRSSRARSLPAAMNRKKPDNDN